MDFKGQLKRQLLFLENSCRLYDQGCVEEAVRIAVCLRVLFHDSNKSISVLHHLNSKNIMLLSTAEVFKKPQSISLPLVRLDVQVDKIKAIMLPFLDKAPRSERVPFHSWWRKEKVIELNGGQHIHTRRDLILAAANKDGGAHVDTELEPIYKQLEAGAGVSIKWELNYGLGIVKTPFENTHFASLRQVAYEALNSSDLKNLVL